MKIAVIGLGYVGLSLSVLLSQRHEVVGVDISEQKVKMINSRVCPLDDLELSDFLSNKILNLRATLNCGDAIKDAKFIIIATPTNFDPEKNLFDTSSIEEVIDFVLNLNPMCNIVIKSTIPIGYVRSLRERFSTNRIMFSPEFLREGKALSDNLYPSRIIVGDYTAEAKKFAELMRKSASKIKIPVLFMGPDEAEAVKLFSNTYLAMRVSYFNELDNFCISNDLNPREIIAGTCLDSRIGEHYNNPSFGYGGYCLPKDSKQLLSGFEKVPQALMAAIVQSNAERKLYIAEVISKMCPEVIGVYRLIMKSGSDNFREAAVKDILDILSEKGFKIVIFEPGLGEKSEIGFDVETNLESFKKLSSVILANRLTDDLLDVREKVFSRDIFGSD